MGVGKRWVRGEEREGGEVRERGEKEGRRNGKVSHDINGN